MLNIWFWQTVFDSCMGRRFGWMPPQYVFFTYGNLHLRWRPSLEWPLC